MIEVKEYSAVFRKYNRFPLSSRRIVIAKHWV